MQKLLLCYNISDHICSLLLVLTGFGQSIVIICQINSLKFIVTNHLHQCVSGTRQAQTVKLWTSYTIIFVFLFMNLSEGPF